MAGQQWNPQMRGMQEMGGQQMMGMPQMMGQMCDTVNEFEGELQKWQSICDREGDSPRGIEAQAQIGALLTWRDALQRTIDQAGNVPPEAMNFAQRDINETCAKAHTAIMVSRQKLEQQYGIMAPSEEMGPSQFGSEQYQPSYTQQQGMQYQPYSQQYGMGREQYQLSYGQQQFGMGREQMSREPEQYVRDPYSRMFGREPYRVQEMRREYGSQQYPMAQQQYGMGSQTGQYGWQRSQQRSQW